MPIPSLPIGISPYVTLAQIEQATAPRLGPYARRTQSSVATATTTEAFFDDLKSSAVIGGVDNLFVLRRGQLSTGALITVDAADRQRIVLSTDPLTGGVVVDRAWTTAPQAGEYVEFHHLDPAQELRPAVQVGLRRCYFEDRVSVSITQAAAERDLTALVAWITRPAQIRRYQFTTVDTNLVMQPTDVPWAEPFEQAGHVWLGSWPDTYPSTLLLTALRPVWTLVNGADSTTGPMQDWDQLNVDLDYATAAAHIEAWRLVPSKLKAAADGGFQATQLQAAAEFTRLAQTQRRRRRTGWNLSGPFSVSLPSRVAR